MNLTYVVMIAAGLGVAGFYAKGRFDENQRATVAKLREEARQVKATAERMQRLQAVAASEAAQARKMFAAKEQEANDLRKELAERGKVVACRWTPSQRNRLRSITIGSTPSRQ